MSPVRDTALLLGLAVQLFACGRTLIEQAGGTSGGGASAGPSGSGPSSGTNNPANGSNGALTTSASAGPDPALCDNFCAVATNCLDGCHHVCATYQIPPCQVQGAALVACLVAHFDPTTCQGPACDQQTKAFTQCRSTVPQDCGGGGGGGTAAECGETAQCPGGDERTLCDIQAGVAQCACYLNYLPVGTCSANVSTSGPPTGLEACNVKKGCCAQFFGT